MGASVVTSTPSSSGRYRDASSGPVAIPGSYSLPPRPGHGTEGRKISLETNFFPITVPRHLTLFQYDVVIQPEVPWGIKRKVMQKAVETYRDRFAGQYPVFDGKKIMYCYKRLAQNQISMPDVVVDDRGRERKFEVTVKYTSHVVQCDDLPKVMGCPEQRMEIIQALDLILRQGAVLKPE